MPVRGIVFRLEAPLPPEAGLLLKDFRLAVNEAIRVGIQSRASSRNALAKLAYKDFRVTHSGIYSQHLVSAFEVAASALKNYRRRVRFGRISRLPYVRRLTMRTENQAYRLDRKAGIVDLPIRAGCHVTLRLIISRYHRRYLDDESLSLGSLTLLPDRVVIAFRKDPPTSFRPTAVLSLDTNERSMNGVFVKDGSAASVLIAFPEIPLIQQRHHDRRAKLQKKKAHDRRTSRRLCKREGKREHDRVQYRLHSVADKILSFADKHRSAIVLEDLTGLRYKKNNDLNRRLSMWPRRKLHDIIEYKAAWRGIPVMKVDPRYSSRRCPICGRIQDSRMGAPDKEFRCECGWHLDRHINASLNLLQTAISKGLEVAGGLRFDPGAFQHDVVMILYEPERAARSEPNGTSCLCGVTS